MIKPAYQHIISPQMADAIGKVGVLYGGLSAEREVSLAGGKAVYEALNNVGIDTLLIDVDETFLSVVLEKPFDFAVIVLHGRGGEDGSVQAILDWLKIPYTGSGVRASAIAMDKVRTKQLWQAAGLPVLPQMLLDDDFDADTVIANVGLPMAVKPALEGSSVGVCKVTSQAELHDAYQSGKQHNSVIMAERWVEGEEYTGAIIGQTALPLIRICMNDGFYDYEAKYVTGASDYLCPCGLPTAVEKQIQQLMLQAANVVGIKDWARVDAMMDSDGKMWLIEINTIPGMTKTSLVPKAAQQAGHSFEETVLMILKASWEKYHA